MDGGLSFLFLLITAFLLRCYYEDYHEQSLKWRHLPNEEKGPWDRGSGLCSTLFFLLLSFSREILDSCSRRSCSCTNLLFCSARLDRSTTAGRPAGCMDKSLGEYRLALFAPRALAFHFIFEDEGHFRALAVDSGWTVSLEPMLGSF